MGASASRGRPARVPTPEPEPEEALDLSQLPPELLLVVLSHAWSALVDCQALWLLILARGHGVLLPLAHSCLPPARNCRPSLLGRFCERRPIGRNLIRNPCGQEGLWKRMVQLVKNNTQGLISCHNKKKFLGHMKAADRRYSMVLENVKEMWTKVPKTDKGKKKSKPDLLSMVRRGKDRGMEETIQTSSSFLVAWVSPSSSASSEASSPSKASPASATKSISASSATTLASKATMASTTTSKTTFTLRLAQSKVTVSFNFTIFHGLLGSFGIFLTVEVYKPNPLEDPVSQCFFNRLFLFFLLLLLIFLLIIILIFLILILLIIIFILIIILFIFVLSCALGLHRKSFCKGFLPFGWCSLHRFFFRVIFILIFIILLIVFILLLFIIILIIRAAAAAAFITAGLNSSLSSSSSS
ncbi:hypothetical protein GH733_005876 [Mirounga leonina]|nr:hypothetical protein GH733_005876 [Mirounga leonina]